jgi:hypothetical protein
LTHRERPVTNFAFPNAACATTPEVALQLNTEWMEKVPFFKACPSMMLIKLSFVLQNESYPPEVGLYKFANPVDP